MRQRHGWRRRDCPGQDTSWAGCREQEGGEGKVERCGLEELTDQELMALSVKDDRKAFEVLVLRYYQEVIWAAEDGDFL